MRTQQKTKNTPIKKAKQKSSASARAVAYVSHPGLRHFRLASHKHTGKLIHHRHTSHVALVGILLIVGFFLYASESITRAQQVTGGGSVSIGAVVMGPAPVAGATITGPTDGTSVVNRDTIEVTGTCEPGTFVVVLNNNELAGSTVCTSAGIFMMQIQLQPGSNVLSALNYDNLNQSGPNTPFVSITVKLASDALRVAQTGLPVSLPSNPSRVVGVGPEPLACGSEIPQTLPLGGKPRIAVICVPRFIQINTEYALGVIAWGGSPPYALDIAWGDKIENTLLSVVANGTRTVNFSYASADIHTITLRLTDADGISAIVQTSVQVNGDTAITPLAVLTSSLLHTSWFKTPVPLYMLAVTITLGFWGGDIFDRYFGARRHHSRPRKAA